MSAADLKAEDFELAWRGAKADVRMSLAEMALYNQAIVNEDEISAKRRTQLARYFTEFCENDDYHRRLNDKQFKNQGKFKDGLGGKATIWAFKAWQWRVYGAIMNINWATMLCWGEG
jgi:hypothetical protein